MIISAAELLAQTDDGIVPSEPGQLVIWAIVGAVILWLYFTIRRTKRRASQDYWDRRKAEEDMRRNDPDMRQDG